MIAEFSRFIRERLIRKNWGFFSRVKREHCMFRPLTSIVSTLSSVVANSQQTMQPRLPSSSSNRTCRFPASGSPTVSRLKADARS